MILSSLPIFNENPISGGDKMKPHIFFSFLCLFFFSSLAFGQGPSIPKSIRTTEITETSVSIAWDESTADAGISHYNIVYHYLPEGGSPVYGITQSSSNSATINNLLSGTQYRFVVIAQDNNGNSSGESQDYPVYTLGATPGNTMKSYIFGHSLVNHAAGEQNIPHWMNELSDLAGETYMVDGQFGFLALQQLPPIHQWGFEGVLSAWDQSFANSDYDNVIITAANYIQYYPPSDPHIDGKSTVQETLRLLDYVRQEEPGIPFYIYENWPEFKEPFPFDPEGPQSQGYHDYTLGEFHEWWMELQDIVNTQRPAANVKLIPTGSIISGLLTEIEPLRNLTNADLYVDGDPHGNGIMYYLAALTHYMAIHEKRTPANFQAPNSIPQEVRENYAEIVEYIWDALITFNYNDGSSRVFLNETSQSSSSQILSSSSITPSSSSELSSSEVPLSSSSSSSEQISSSEEPFSSSVISSSSENISSSSIVSQNNPVFDMGINTSGVVDWSIDRPFADAWKTARHHSIREITESRQVLDTQAPMDENGWPLTDFTAFVYQTLRLGNHGTYKLRFEGQADVSTPLGTVENIQYDEENNISIMDIVISNEDNTDLWLDFYNTNGGVKNIQLMRPLTPGSSDSYPFDQEFTNEYLELLAPYSTIRYMGWTNTNNSNDSLWEQTVPWNFATLHVENYYASWESVIKLSNAAQKDAWINVPHKVDDEYIRQLALLFKNGSESVEPLDPNLNLYVEYSNEIWNWGGWFLQTNWTFDQSRDYGHPLDFDGEDDNTTLMHRYKVMRSVTISKIFREVFGDEQMMSRIRPVICWQNDWNDMTNRTMSFIDRYYNARDSRSDVQNPHPANYYFYGGGGSGYWHHEEGTTVDSESIWNSGGWNQEVFADKIFKDAAWAKSMGLEYITYEGDNHHIGDESDDVYREVHWDERMYQETIDHLNAFVWVGGKMWAFLVLGNIDDNAVWGAYHLYNGLDGSPQYRAVLDLAETPAPPPRYGDMIPFSTPGQAYDVFGLMDPQPDAEGALNLVSNSYAYASSYMFRSGSRGVCNVRIEYSTQETADLALEVDGNTLNIFSVESTNGNEQSTVPQEFHCSSNQMHSLRLSALNNSIVIHSIHMDIDSTTILPDLSSSSEFDQSSSSEDHLSSDGSNSSNDNNSSSDDDIASSSSEPGNESSSSWNEDSSSSDDLAYLKRKTRRRKSIRTITYGQHWISIPEKSQAAVIYDISGVKLWEQEIHSETKNFFTIPEHLKSRSIMLMELK